MKIRVGVRPRKQFKTRMLRPAPLQKGGHKGARPTIIFPSKKLTVIAEGSESVPYDLTHLICWKADSLIQSRMKNEPISTDFRASLTLQHEVDPAKHPATQQNQVSLPQEHGGVRCRWNSHLWVSHIFTSSTRMLKSLEFTSCCSLGIVGSTIDGSFKTARLRATFFSTPHFRT